MPSLPLQNLADYTIVDEWVQRADEFVQGTPYWVLILITAFLFVIFIYGLVKKLVVFTIVVAVLIAAICGIWYVAGHTSLS